MRRGSGSPRRASIRVKRSIQSFFHLPAIGIVFDSPTVMVVLKIICREGDAITNKRAPMVDPLKLSNSWKERVA